MLSKKIIFITGNLTQPRVIKRIKAFKEQGFDICVYGFDRGTFQNVNVLSSDIPVECLGHLENSQQYFKSLLLNRKNYFLFLENIVIKMFGIIHLVLFLH